MFIWGKVILLDVHHHIFFLNRKAVNAQRGIASIEEKTSNKVITDINFRHQHVSAQL